MSYFFSRSKSSGKSRCTVAVCGASEWLVLESVFTRRSSEIATGVVLLFFFGGLLLGVLPGQPGVSWQGHLFGAIGGGLAAAWVSARPRRRRYDAFT